MDSFKMEERLALAKQLNEKPFIPGAKVSAAHKLPIFRDGHYPIICSAYVNEEPGKCDFKLQGQHSKCDYWRYGSCTCKEISDSFDSINNVEYKNEATYSMPKWQVEVHKLLSMNPGLAQKCGEFAQKLPNSSGRPNKDYKIQMNTKKERLHAYFKFLKEETSEEVARQMMRALKLRHSLNVYEDAEYGETYESLPGEPVIDPFEGII